MKSTGTLEAANGTYRCGAVGSGLLECLDKGGDLGLVPNETGDWAAAAL
jgi:hypothetical protein